MVDSIEAGTIRILHRRYLRPLSAEGTKCDDDSSSLSLGMEKLASVFVLLGLSYAVVVFVGFFEFVIHFVAFI